MTVNELVLTSLENLEAFRINDVTLTRTTYEKYYDYEIKSYYLDINKITHQPYINIILEEC